MSCGGKETSKGSTEERAEEEQRLWGCVDGDYTLGQGHGKNGLKVLREGWSSF